MHLFPPCVVGVSAHGSLGLCSLHLESPWSHEDGWSLEDGHTLKSLHPIVHLVIVLALQLLELLVSGT